MNHIDPASQIRDTVCLIYAKWTCERNRDGCNGYKKIASDMLPHCQCPHDDFEDRPTNCQSDFFLVFNFHPTQQVGSAAQDSRFDSMAIFQSWEPFCHKGKNCFYCSKFKTLNPNILFVEW